MGVVVVCVVIISPIICPEFGQLRVPPWSVVENARPSLLLRKVCVLYYITVPEF